MALYSASEPGLTPAQEALIMPYAITGYAGGTLRQVVLQDDGTVTGDGLVTGWLSGNPPPATDVDAVTLHIGKLLTEVHATPLPDPPPPVPDATGQPVASGPAADAAPAVAETHAAYTQAELEELTVTDLREMATMAGVAGAARLSKADLVAALLTQQGS